MIRSYKDVVYQCNIFVIFMKMIKSLGLKNSYFNFESSLLKNSIKNLIKISFNCDLLIINLILSTVFNSTDRAFPGSMCHPNGLTLN